MIKSVICIVCTVIFLVINTIILFLRPEFNYALNDDENYVVYFQKWIGTAVFMMSLIIALIAIDLALEYQHFLCVCLLVIECLLVIIYALVKYKGVTVSGEEILVQRLFRKNFKTKFSNITKVTYIPNAKLVIKAKRKETFDISFNSENFYKFYKSLLDNNVKFKTGRIPYDENHVYLSKYEMTIDFPKTMFREYYQSKYFLRNSKYLFSARSLENHEYIEGYYKESEKDLAGFIEIIKNDLNINGFKVLKEYKETFDGFEFNLIRCDNKNNKQRRRTAYIYQSKGNYFVIYTDYEKDNEEIFMQKMRYAIRKAAYEDAKSRIAKI